MIKTFDGEYSWLSNCEPSPIEYKGITYPSVVHAVVSAKNDTVEWKKTCANTNFSASAIRALGRQVDLVENWDTLRLEVMAECIKIKFSEYPYRLLLAVSSPKHIQAGNYDNERFWGVCMRAGVGGNNLGKIIMDVRTQIIKEIKEKWQTVIKSQVSKIISKIESPDTSVEMLIAFSEALDLFKIVKE